MEGRRDNVDIEAQIIPKPQIGVEAPEDRYCTLAIIRHIMEPRHYLERIWWIVVFGLSITGCTIAILNIWNTWKNHPITVIFDDTTTPISEIPFPAVTVCTTQKFKWIIDNQTEINKDDLDAFSQVCSMIFENGGFNSHDLPIYETIERMSPDESSVISVFEWKYSLMTSLFKPIFTSKGLCFTFNSLNSREIYTDLIAPELLTVRKNPNAKHWNADEGYRSNINESELYPYRVIGTDVYSSLGFMADILLDMSFEYCRLASPGFNVMFHMPDEFVSSYAEYNMVTVDQYVNFLIKPKVTVTSEGLRNYAPHVRGCYFRPERQLRFFKLYSQNNCKLECLANFTKKVCGCVQFYMPRDNETKVCRSSDTECMGQTRDRFSEERTVKQCDCLSDCISILYESNLSQTQRFRFQNKQEQIVQFGHTLSSVIRIQFNEPNFIAIKRVATTTISEFISNCGGLLGLFMGVSVLSIVELLCFFILRMGRRLGPHRVAPINAQTWATRTRNPHLQRRLSV